MTKTTICLVDGCDKIAMARGHCNLHYQRLLSGKDMSAPARPNRGTPAMFMMGSLMRYEEECIDWPYSTTKGTATIRHGDGSAYVARMVCEIKNGPPPSPDHQAAHWCGRGHLGCINWRHVRWATEEENAADKKAHGTHKEGEQIPWSKLTEADVLEIRRLTAKGDLPQSQIAIMFGVTQSNVSWIHRRKSWDHI